MEINVRMKLTQEETLQLTEKLLCLVMAVKLN